MQNQIKIEFSPKRKRLLITCPFHLNDLVRNFPSRRFEPKDKKWSVPLVRANIEYIAELQRKYELAIDADATEAIAGAEALIALPPFVPFPPGYDFLKAEKKYPPMEHQTRMLDRAWGQKNHAWFAKMGTGKTFASIHMICARAVSGEIDAVVIICPSTLCLTWQKEFAKYATIKYDFRIHTTKARWYDEFRADKSTSPIKVLAVSVEGLGVSEQSYDSVCGFFPGRRILCIVDESSRIKNPKALRTKRTIELGAAATTRLILNGTPIALGIQDLFSQYEFLDPNIIGVGDYWAYRSRYLVMGGYEQKQIVGYQHIDELMERIRPYTTEVDKSVLNLPPKVYKERYITATAEQKALFKYIIKGEGNFPYIKAENTLERMLRLRQVVGGWRPESHENEDGVWETKLIPLSSNPKFNDLKEFIDDNYQGSKFIIWSTFVHEIEAIGDYLRSEYGPDSVALYYGKTDRDTRSEIEDRYCNSDLLRFFVGNPASAGLGLTLVSKLDDTMYYYSGTSAFIDRTQSEDRAHRIGQKDTVTVVDAIMNKTVDEAIQAATAMKKDVETYVFEQIREGKTEIDLFGG